MARVQAKKVRPKTLKLTIFELHKCSTPQKKAENNRYLYWNKITDFWFEKNEKMSIPPFPIPKNCNLLSVLTKFLENLSR